MLSIIAGGRDVSGNAERAEPSDRLAVGEITVANSITPNPRTLAGADGRRSTPSLFAVGAKSDGPSQPSSVGAASERKVGIHESRQAVTHSPSRSLTSSLADVKPEADTLLPSVSGAYSASLEEQLERAELALACAEMIDNWPRCRRETAECSSRIALIKRRIAERDGGTHA